MLSADLIAVEGSAGFYHVRFAGELVLKRSRNPECDLARVLLARGIKGKVKMLDAVTGKHRSTIDIAKAAVLTVEEGPNGPRFVKIRQSRVERAPAAETPVPVSSSYPETTGALGGADTREITR